MVHHLTKCPHHWRPQCYPQRCTPPPRPGPSLPPQAGQPIKPTHNIVYLVDEHKVTSASQKFVRNGDTLRKRYAFHHQVANLETFNVGEYPDTIELHKMISDPGANPSFRWEGFMFDIPGGNAACRVAIVADADKAGNATLTGPGGAQQANIDRVVGFAGMYTDNQVPLGPIVQVRRDDQYRFLGASVNQEPKVAWYCAYYITKETPKQPTATKAGFHGTFSLMAEEDNQDQTPAGDQGTTGDDSGTTMNYDQLLDQNVADEIRVAPNKEGWGGMVFGFDTSDLNPGSYDDEALKDFDGSAVDELKDE